jgi:two-component system response regulator AtoC
MTIEHKLRILLVDDEEIVRETLGDYLRDCGYHVDEAGDGTAALQAIDADHYDLALVDVKMPGMDGLSFLSSVRERSPEMEVIIVSGHGDNEMSEKVSRLGAAEFLVKPVSLFELDGILEKILTKG